jgi:hypothetical protein
LEKESKGSKSKSSLSCREAVEIAILVVKEKSKKIKIER